MARATLIEAEDEELIPHPSDAVFAVLADVPAYPRWWPEDVGVELRRAGRPVVGAELELDPTAGRRFALRFTGVEEPRRLEVAYVASWLEGEGAWTLRRKGRGTLVRYEMQVRADRWIAALAGRLVDLQAIHARQMRLVLEGLGAETARRHRARLGGFR